MTPAIRNSSSASLHPNSLRFPFLDLKTEYSEIRTEILESVTRLLEKQEFIMGEEVDRFEDEIAERLGISFAIGCASGTDALLLSLLGCGIGQDHEVITSPFTFVATAGAIVRAGARPVFVDIEADSFNIDPEKLEDAISANTRAIIPVHLFGQSSELDAIVRIASRHNLHLIEDAAQAIGAKYRERPIGSFGIAGCFSFFPSKNLGAAGDAGMVTTDDENFANRIRMLRVHGSRRKYFSEVVGVNSRLDALQAAILRVKMRRLDSWTEARRNNAQRYRLLFVHAGLERYVQLPVEQPDRTHVYNQFVIAVEDRDRLRDHLRMNGIPTEVYYPTPLHLQPAFAALGYQKGDFPRAEAASLRALALPISPTLKEDQQVEVVQAIANFFTETSNLKPNIASILVPDGSQRQVRVD